MKRSALLTAVLVLACVLAWSACSAADETSEKGTYGQETADAVTFSITYETNGGTLPSDAPAFYIAGCYTSLPTPERDGYVFAGWCSDAGLTDPVGAILATDSGDMELHAKWIEGTEAGTGFVMEASGRCGYGDSAYTIAGTVEYGRVAESNGALLLRIESEISFSRDDGGWIESGTSYSWIETLTDGWTCTGSEQIDGEPLTVWTDGSRTMWVRDMTVIVQMTVPYDLWTYTLTLAETTTCGTGGEFVPDVTAEYPVTLSGVEGIGLGESTTLTASGDSFAGWYLNGVLVSTDSTCTFERLTPADAIVAAASVTFTVVENGDGIASLGFGDAEITDSDGDAVSGLSDLEPGLYSCVLRGVPTVTADLVVEGSRTFSIEWSYDGRSYSYETVILCSDVLRYGAEFGSSRVNQSLLSRVEELCTWSDGYLADIALTLRGLGADLDEVGFAEFVLKFVQAVPYVGDQESRGCSDFWKFPLETLWDGGGDCEDLSVLYATLMGMLGYRTAYVQFDGHAMAAVTLDAEGWTVSTEGYTFVLCETTDSRYSIGVSSEGHLPPDALRVVRLECFPADFRL